MRKLTEHLEGSGIADAESVEAADPRCPLLPEGAVPSLRRSQESAFG